MKNFSARKKARRYAVQALYSWEMTGNSSKDIEAFILAEHPEEEFDKEYFSLLLHQTIQQIEDLDDSFQPYLARKLEELDFVELAVLRIATFELKHRVEIPYKVIINEALNITKTFGATEAHKFVNGVLDKLAKELRPSEIQG